MTDEEARCFELLRLARAEADGYGVTLEPRLVRGRHAGEQIVEEARRSGAQLIVLQAHPRRRAGRRGSLFASSAAWVLRRAPCRVLVAAPRDDARAPGHPAAGDPRVARHSVAVGGAKRLLIGRPRATRELGETLLPKVLALPIFASTRSPPSPTRPRPRLPSS